MALLPEFFSKKDEFPGKEKGKNGTRAENK